MIGERIKTLRKEKKLTQTQLSEGIITKSMLSMIENGKAEASMRSLREIAQRLDVPVQSLLSDPRESELQDWVERIEYADLGFEKWKREDILRALSPYIEEEMESIWQGRAYVLYGDAILDDENHDLVLEFYDRAINLFERLGEKDEIAMTRIGQAYYLLHWNRFEEASEKMEWIEVLDLQSMKPKTRIEYYMLLVFKELLYEDSISSALKHLEEALQYMKQTRTYYRADDVYRAMVICGLYLQNDSLIQLAMLKARQYVEFTEDSVARTRLAFTEALSAMMKENAEELGYHVRKLEQILSHEAGNQNSIAPLDMFRGVYHAMIGEKEIARKSFVDLWETRSEWQINHSLIDQAIYLEGLLLGTLYGCGDEWLSDIETIPAWPVSPTPDGIDSKNQGLMFQPLNVCVSVPFPSLTRTVAYAPLTSVIWGGTCPKSAS